MQLNIDRHQLFWLLSPLYISLSGICTASESLQSLLANETSIAIHTSSPAAGKPMLSFRGLTSANSAINSSAPITVTVDGLPRFHQGLSTTEWVDLDMISIVDQSPAKTSSNRALGEIQINTRQPSFNDRSATITTAVENSNRRSVDAIFNYAFDDNISAYRVAASYLESGGSVEATDDEGLDYQSIDSNQLNGGRGLRLRGQYRLQPNSHIELTLAADYDKSDEACCASITLERDQSLSTFFTSLGLPSNGGFSAVGKNALQERRSNSSDSFHLNEVANYSGTARFHIADTTLQLGTVYSEYSSKQRYSLDTGSRNIFSVRGNLDNVRNSRGQFDDIRRISHQLRWDNHESGESILWAIGASYSLSKYEQAINSRLGSDYQRYHSAQINQALQALNGASFTDIDPALNPNVLFTLAEDTDAAGSFANNLYKSRKEETLLYWNNRWLINKRFSIEAELNALLSTEDGGFSQVDASSAACESTLANANLGAVNPQTDLYRLLVETACPSAASSANITVPSGLPIAQTFSASHKTASWGGHLNAKLNIDNSNALTLVIASSTLPGAINLNPAAQRESATSFREQQQYVYQLGFNSSSVNDRLNIGIDLFHYDIRNLQTTLPFDGSHDIAKRSLVFNIDNALLTGFETTLSYQWTQALTSSVRATYIDQRTASNCSANTDFSASEICDKRSHETPETRVSIMASYRGPIIAHKRLTVNSALRYESARELADYLSVANDSSIDSSIQIDLELGLKPISPTDPQWELVFYAKNLGDQPARGFFTLPGQPNSLGASFTDPERYGMRFTFNL